jgi:hypothetical protein
VNYLYTAWMNLKIMQNKRQTKIVQMIYCIYKISTKCKYTIIVNRSVVAW